MKNKVNMSSISNKIKFIYGDECEKNTAGIIMFSDGTNYFFDAEFKNKMSNEEVEALLLRGAVIFKDGKYYRPASFDNAEVSMVSAGLASNDIPNLFFYGSYLPTTKDDIPLEMDYKSNSLSFHSYVMLKCQGSSSMSYDKKNFTVTFYEDENREKPLKKNFRGWGNQNKFCLKANWVDTTHSRNVSCARIAYDMIDSRPDSPFKQQLLQCPRKGVVDGFPIKLYFNGEFWGIYTFNIPKGAWMFGMDENDPKHSVLCAEYNSNGDVDVITSCQFRETWNTINTQDHWKVEVGEATDEIRASFNRCIDFVRNSSDEEFHNNISEYFDLYSLLDYYCFSYFMCHMDGLAKNLLMATYDGRIWGASLYDMDSCYGANWDGFSFLPPDYRCPQDYQEPYSLLWERIEKCFTSELIERYNELRKDALSLTNIISHVEEIYDLLNPNMKTDELTKWAPPSHEQNTMTRLRNFMRDRAIYVDGEFPKIGGEIVDPTERIVKYTFSKTVNGETIDFTPTITGVTDYEIDDVDNGDTITRELKFASNEFDSITKIQFGQDEDDVTNKSLSLLRVDSLPIHSLVDCKNMFRKNENLSYINTNGFNTGNATTMREMFSGCFKLNNLNVQDWDTSQVEDMTAMFSSCYELNGLYVDNWDVKKLVYTTNMFNRCYNISTINVGGWDVSNMLHIGGMFYGCGSLSSLNVSNWNTVRVEDVGWMFGDCQNLTAVNISNWDTSNMSNLDGVFSNCNALVTLTINGWSNVSKAQSVINTLPIGDDGSNTIYSDLELTAPEGWTIQ